MKMLKSLFFGIRLGKAAIVAALVLYLATFIFSSLAQLPLNRGFHGALDEVPTASGLATDDRLDIFIEMIHINPSLLNVGLLGIVTWTLLFIPVALFLLAGVYAQAAGASEGVIRGLWRGGVKFFLPFALLFLFNLVVLGIMVVLIVLFLAAVAIYSSDNYDSTLMMPLLALRVVFAALLLNLWRNSVGYSQAHYVLRGEIDGLGRSFLKGFLFSLRRLIPVNILTWLYNGLRGLSMYLFAVILWSGYAATGAWFKTALFLQIAFLLCALARVAEVRTQVDYLRRFLPEPEVEAEIVQEQEPQEETDPWTEEDPDATQLVGPAVTDS